MKYILNILLVLSILSFQACSRKSVDTSSNDTLTHQELEEDEFLEEFEDEMEIEEKTDPLNHYNRIMTSFNDNLFTYILNPVSKAYKEILHKEIRASVGNFFHNILFPIRVVNNTLQGKIKNASEETGRFVINSTIGILGLFDPAKSYFDLNAHEEDFGQTLGFYGVGAGPHIVLPFFGPSNLRDSLSMYPDAILNPVNYNDERAYNLVRNYNETILTTILDKVNYTSQNIGMYEKIKEDSVDLYPYLRDIYEQRREQQIKE